MLTSGILGAIGAATLFSGSSFALAVKRDATPTSGTLSLTFSSYNGVATPTNIPSMSEANSKDTINVNIRMDGGGGGSLNGRTVAIFSDTSTYNGSTSDKYAKIVSGGFVSNSAYYISDTSNPLAIEGFRNESNHGLPALAVPWFEDECPTSYDCDWWIWPNNGFATQNNLATDTVGYGMYDAGKRNGTKPWEYKTLAKLEADDTGVTITRPVQAYITSAFKKKWGWSVASDGDGFVHVFATYGSNEDGTTNLYAAKVRWDEIEDTSKFRYYNGTHYAFAGATDAEANVAPIAAGYFNTGDVFYSKHLSTWVIVCMGGVWNHRVSMNTIYVQYSTTGMAHGPYSPPQTVIGTYTGPSSYNYGFHVYPKFFDTTSQEILTSWSFGNGTEIKMGKITFDP